MLQRDTLKEEEFTSCFLVQRVCLWLADSTAGGPDQAEYQGSESEAVSLGTKEAEIERVTGMHHGQGLAFKVTQPSN